MFGGKEISNIKLFIALLIILLALSVNSTEVYICGWYFETYDCKLLGAQEQDTYDETEEYSMSYDDELQNSHIRLPVDKNILSQ